MAAGNDALPAISLGPRRRHVAEDGCSQGRSCTNAPAVAQPVVRYGAMNDLERTPVAEAALKQPAKKMRTFRAVTRTHHR